MKKAFICVADGFEEVETITPVDYLRRCGIDAVLIGLETNTVRSSRGLTIRCDTVLSEVIPYAKETALVVLPGGLPNSETLGKSTQLRSFIETVYESGGIIAAICAAPCFTLGAWGLLDGKKFTCYPGMGTELLTKPITDVRVVRDDRIITACAAGAAEEFAFALVESLCGESVLTTLKAAIAAR
ncbi:MAG: DJ-1 family glyoxalase III [Treponema sp.]